jgi:hypothetical protein
MDMLPSDKNLGIGGMNRKGIQTPLQEEIIKNPEKTDAGTAVQQGDKVEITSVLPKKDETGVQNFSLKENESRYGQMLADMKNFIINHTQNALNAQAGNGGAFLKVLYP